jgi:hypothetical protein
MQTPQCPRSQLRVSSIFGRLVYYCLSSLPIDAILACVGHLLVDYVALYPSDHLDYSVVLSCLCLESDAVDV